MAYCKLGVEGTKVVAEMVAVSQSLTCLRIEANAIGDEGCAALAEAMQQNESCKIEELGLSNNRIGDAGAKSLAAMIAVRGSLTAADTCRNEIDGEGAEQLAAAVLGSSSMVTFGKIPIKKLRADAQTTLDLRGKDLGPTEALVLAGLLPVSGSLSKVFPPLF